MSTEVKRLYATSDVARICGVSHAVVKKWVRERVIDFYQLSNGFYCFDEKMLADIKAWSIGRRPGWPTKENRIKQRSKE